MRQLVQLQDEVEVAYTGMVSITVDPPEVISAFRAGVGARWTILSDADRVWQQRLDLEEATDPTNRPYVPAMFTLFPDLTIHKVYAGYWFWGRATLEDLRQDMRAISKAVREDFGYLGGSIEKG
jgi:hypothetical protein